MEPEHQTGLWSILDQALVAIVNDRPSAPALVSAFISDVQGLVQGGHLDDFNGTVLIQDAEGVLAVLVAS
jgi:hypothetical protein